VPLPEPPEGFLEGYRLGALGWPGGGARWGAALAAGPLQINRVLYWPQTTSFMDIPEGMNRAALKVLLRAGLRGQMEVGNPPPPLSSR